MFERYVYCVGKTGFFLMLFLYADILFGDSLTISGNPAPMTISTATAGSNPNSVTNSATTCSIVTLLVGKSIVGSINTNMPTGSTLRVQIVAPSGATSAGSVALTTTPVNLVTGIPILSLINILAITYTLSATAAAAPVTSATRTVTLTLQ